MSAASLALLDRILAALATPATTPVVAERIGTVWRGDGWQRAEPADVSLELAALERAGLVGWDGEWFRTVRPGAFRIES